MNDRVVPFPAFLGAQTRSMGDFCMDTPESFRIIVREFSADLLRMAFHFVRDWDQAEDLAQLTFIKCYRSRHRYDPRRPFRAWLYRIHINTCKGAARRAARLQAREIRLDEFSDPGSAPPMADDSDLIMRHIVRLPAKQRTAFILVAIEGLSSLEAAYILGCSDATIRVHVARARATLRSELSKLGIGYGSAG